jgi:threonylcarbamoyladenosine tRNA methylthiotransferase CDKAL1
MAKIYQHPRMYSYLHCPIQSASDKVLDDMRREYTRGDFERIVDFLRERVPHITIATDLIVGFPNEDEDDFAQTVDLVNKYQFNVLFINQFYPRPGTPAARMKRVPTEIVKRRSREVSAIFKSSRPYDGRLGKVYDILVAEHAPDGTRFAGRNKSYEMILVEADPRIMGRMVTVKIIETDKWRTLL